MKTMLALLNDYERGLVRQALYVASSTFIRDAQESEDEESVAWMKKVSEDMKIIRGRIERDPLTGW